MELRKFMKNNGEIIVKQIPRELAKDTCLKNHYSKKWNTSFGKYNFGIYKVTDTENLLGVAVFGNLMNPKSYKSICNGIEQDEIIELNRLWVDDCLGHNTETVFLSLCFKWLKTNTNIKLIQSFADGRLGCGTIYKASNFKYYGYSESLFFENITTNEVLHKTPFENTSRLPKMVGQNIGYIRECFHSFTVKTYRYIYFLNKDYINKCLLKELNYPVYEKGLRYVEHKQPCRLIARCYVACDKLLLNDLSNEFMLFMKNNFDEKEILESIKIANENENLNKYLKEKKQSYIIEEIEKYNVKYK